MNKATSKIYHDSFDQASQCGLIYEAVDLTGGAYTTERPFRAIALAEAGNVEIVGIDEVAVVVPLQAGINPTGGIGINVAGTDATSLVVVF